MRWMSRSAACTGCSKRRAGSDPRPRLTDDTCYIGSDDGYLYCHRSASRPGELALPHLEAAPLDPLLSAARWSTSAPRITMSMRSRRCSGNLKWKFQTLRGITSSPMVVRMASCSSAAWMAISIASTPQMGWQIWKFKTEPLCAGLAPCRPRLHLYRLDRSVPLCHRCQERSAGLEVPGRRPDQLHARHCTANCSSSPASIRISTACNARTGKLAWRFAPKG